jgi:putative SOS response-associated peptidase YedK
MCGRMNHGTLTWEQLHDWLALGLPPDLAAIPQRFNVAPTLMVPVAYRREGALTAGLARWGLIPFWYRESVKSWRAASFNARAEEVATKPAFRAAYATGRCLVLAAGYYEWQAGPEGKQPFYIHAAGNAPALVFAGLMSSVRLPDYQGLTCTVLTEPARPALAFLHDRSPVMLGEAGAAAWLDGTGVGEVARLEDAQLAWHRVGRAVGSVRNDGPELIEAVE